MSVGIWLDVLKTSVLTLPAAITIGMNDMTMVDAVLDDMAKLIELERELMKASEEAGDDGTNDMVNKFMQFKEKTTWMLRSFAGKK